MNKYSVKQTAKDCIECAQNCDNYLNGINVELLKIDDKKIDLKCSKSTDLSSELFDEMLQLTENNMKEMYDQSSWGWRRDVKQKEFQHKTANFLILTYENRLIAFCHFRFEHGSDQSEACVYCYELQVIDEYQRKGVVFKHNTFAMDFYVNKLKFRIDKSSPSKFYELTDYEILSLKIKKSSKVK